MGACPRERVVGALVRPLYDRHSKRELFASAACGLQNAMVATYSGAAIRTTHLTGIVSDIGSIIGNLLARRRVDWRQLLLLCTIFTSFYSGSSVGTFLFAQLSFGAILVPALLTLIAGASYILYLSYRHHLFAGEVSSVGSMLD
ncbi:MAG: YoaK family protein [Caldilineaceae bacterium]